MKVELSKDDLVTLVMGFNLYNDLINKYSRLEYGHWTGGHADVWTWHKWALERLDEEELYNIYKECRESRIIEED
jgi:hypothetical protein